MKHHAALIAMMISTGRMAAGAPVWATKDTQSVAGNLYTVVCSGTGPNLNDAREHALNQCNLLASRQFGGSTKVQALTIETETQAALHQEVSHEVVVKNLICKPIQEEAEYGIASVSVFVKCRYDLSKSDSQESETARRTATSDQTSSITLSIVPMCGSILIRGAKPRVIKCDRNPISLSVSRSDSEVVIRADGYIPKTIPVNELIGGQATNVFLKSN